MKVYLVKRKDPQYPLRPAQLMPDGAQSEEWLRNLPAGEVMSCEVKRPRNYEHHKKFFALLNLIFENQTHYKSVDDILLAFKCQQEHGHWITIRRVPNRSERVFQPKSISFAQMDQDAFDAFYRKAIDFVVTHVIPGLDRDDLERELMEFA